MFLVYIIFVYFFKILIIICWCSAGQPRSVGAGRLCADDDDPLHLQRRHPHRHQQHGPRPRPLLRRNRPIHRRYACAVCAVMRWCVCAVCVFVCVCTDTKTHLCRTVRIQDLQHVRRHGLLQLRRLLVQLRHLRLLHRAPPPSRYINQTTRSTTRNTTRTTEKRG